MRQAIKLISIFVLVALSGAHAQPGDAEAILERILDNLRGGSGQATITFVVERPERSTRYVMSILSDGDEQGLIQVLEPSRDAGQSFLLDGDNLFLYNPRLRRSLRLPPSGRSESFLGSDVSYNDLAGRDLERDYTVALVEGAEGLLLELTPNASAPTPYGKVQLRADPATFAPLEMTYFDQRGGAVKRVTLSEIIQVEDQHFPTHTLIEDLTRTGYRTEAITSDYTFDVAIPERCFTLQALERGCTF